MANCPTMATQLSPLAQLETTAVTTSTPSLQPANKDASRLPWRQMHVRLDVPPRLVLPTSTATTKYVQTKSFQFRYTNNSPQYPHLIIPIDSSQPDTAFGTSYNGQISSTVSTIFNFDIPTSDSGKTCSLVFLFPTQADLVTSSFTFSGAGTVEFSMLASSATSATDYSNAPAVETDYGTFTVAPGTSTVISTFSCPAGMTVGYELKAVGDTELTYFQDYNPSPIGLYITTC